MASEGQLTSDTCLVRKIPSHLRDIVRSQILNVVGQAKDFSAEIHQQPGQPAKLVYYLHTATGKSTFCNLTVGYILINKDKIKKRSACPTRIKS